MQPIPLLLREMFARRPTIKIIDFYRGTGRWSATLLPFRNQPVSCAPYLPTTFGFPGFKRLGSTVWVCPSYPCALFRDKSFALQSSIAELLREIVSAPRAVF
ncbi:hypothetical protein [Burkholderia pseudomallei]|uniref:hypothetical protein n=1 Tax=Burkholderia pseudomallei TaxID=28450 RepID=UPI0019402321|nr:hypothetical protein [Burkholderia pseudomallei]MBM5584966.1 hypothetical protein [Burkholderia pseudomallei]